MISVFVVLGIVLLAIPIVCAIFVLFSKLKQKKRAEVIKNATITTTTVKKGVNGRTVFETTATKPSPPRAPPRSPVLPFTQQQASKAPRPMSVKNTWQRLSRPFAAAHMTYEDDEIELTQTQKQRPAPHSSRFQKQTSTALDEPISPVSRIGSSSSWNTIYRLDSSPVSPVSITGMPAPSSQHGQPQQGRETLYGDLYKANPYSNSPSGPPTVANNTSRKTKASIDPGSARGFVASTVKERVLTDTNKTKAKQAVMSAAEAAGQYAADSIKKSVLDGKHKTTEVQLSSPPRARLAGTRR